MTNAQFFNQFNKEVQFVQELASRSTSNLAEARKVYLESVHRAMKVKNQMTVTSNFKSWITSIVSNVADEFQKR